MTRKMMLIAGVAGMALTVPALAQKADRGGGQDKQQKQEQPQAQPNTQRGGGGGGGQQAQRAERPQRAERQQVQRAERPQRVERQQVQRAERPQRAERQQVQRAERPQRAERQQVQRVERQQRAERPQRAERQVQRQERQQRVERPQRAERQVERQQRPQRVERQAQRPERQQRIERQQQRQERAQRPERQQRVERQAQRPERQQQRFERRTAERLFAPRVTDGNRDFSNVRTARFDGRGYRPLAPLSFNREMRPMESFASKFDDRNFASIGDRYDTSYNWSPVPAFYGDRFVDNNDYYYRYNDDYGYAYQINRQSNLINSFYPLFGGYGIGDPWPQTYYSSYVPAGYSDYYYDTPDYYYRNDGYGIYQVDAGSQLITALVSLVLGQNYGVGQVLPATYSTYNVPLDYRDQYADNDDHWYRYGDGFIYDVEPGSRRVAARYPLYADDYYVGERWPVAYPDYNVPYAYRSAYADSPQYHYRYANGGIYQVDPNNQIILALAALISGDQFAVGQPMPVGYDIYNVPVDYRDRWADSDDEYYRYANGNVYRVDYDSGLIEEQYSIYS